jgi:two-component system OmpR family sensor kinase
VRLPIRVRLTAWYALLLAAVLVALGAFLVLRLRSDLRSTIDREVRTSSATIVANYSHEGIDGFSEISAAALPRSGSATQVLDPRGRVLVDYGGAVATHSMVPTAARIAALAGRPQLFEVQLGRTTRPFRVMATAAQQSGRRQLVVVAESLQEVNEAVKKVLVLLLIAVPAALAIAGLVGWWLLRRALLPVQRMTRKADQIGIDRLGERLTTPNPTDEIGLLAATLNAMLDRLEAGVETKRRLIADSSHELRTPLAVMRAELDVSLRRDDLTPAERAVLESVREEADRLRRSVDNLLTLAQSDEGRLELLFTDVDLREAIEAAVRPLRGLAAANRLQMSIAGDPCLTTGDPERLRLALTNLIENAIKFTPPGGEITASCWRRGGKVGVTVTDTGTGIPAHAQAQVFDRFYQAHGFGVDAAASPGSGLGLAICREIATAHGGTISVRSAEGRGSAFTLSLPDRDTGSGRAPERANPSPAPAPR